MIAKLPSGSQIRLRALEPADVDALYLWENSPEMRQFGAFQAPYSRLQLWEYVHNYDSNPLSSGQLRLMIDIDGSAAGAIDLYNIDATNSRAMVGIMVSKQHRRLGAGLAALNLICDYVSEALSIRQLAALVAEDNIPSANLFSKAGFQHTATIPSWIKRKENFASAMLFQKFL